MSGSAEVSVSRKNIAVRLIRAVVCWICFEVARIALLLSMLFQFGWLLIARRHSEPLRRLDARLCAYAHQALRYATLADNPPPFPFGPAPDYPDVAAPAKDVRFD